jgi:hypothetical protein
MIKAAHLGVSHGQIHLGMAHYYMSFAKNAYIHKTFIY